MTHRGGVGSYGPRGHENPPAGPAEALNAEARLVCRSWGDYPFSGLAGHCGDRVVVLVVVQHRDLVPRGSRGDQQVRQLGAAMLALGRETGLHLTRGVPYLVGHGQQLESLKILAKLPVLSRRLGGIQHLQFDHGAHGYETGHDQRFHALVDRRLAEPVDDGRVGKVAGYRHPSSRVTPSNAPDLAASSSRRRAAALTTSASAALTVSRLVLVPRTSRAASSSSSSVSIMVRLIHITSSPCMISTCGNY